MKKQTKSIRSEISLACFWYKLVLRPLCNWNYNTGYYFWQYIHYILTNYIYE